MPEQQIYSNTRSHWDNDGDPNPAEAGSGHDEHVFTIPSGEKFSRYELQINANTAFSSASVVQAPSADATGQQKIKVKWAFNPFGKIAYTLKVFSGAAVEPVEIHFGTPNAPQQAFDLIQQKKPLRLVVSGPDALALTDVFRKARNLGPLTPAQNSYSAAIGTGEVMLAAVICATIVAVVTLLVIVTICVVAIHYNYKVAIDYSRNGPLPFDDRLTIRLDPV